MTIEHKTTPPPKKKKEQATIWKIINDHRAQNHSPFSPQKSKKQKKKWWKFKALSHYVISFTVIITVMHAHVVAQKKFH